MEAVVMCRNDVGIAIAMARVKGLRGATPGDDIALFATVREDSEATSEAKFPVMGTR